MDRVEGNLQSPIYYTEDPHPPAFHAIPVVEATNDQGSITPCLVLDSMDGGEPEVINKSDALLRRFCPELYPAEIADEVKAMEDMLGERLGPTLRAFAYHHLLQPSYYDVLAKLASSKTTRVENFLFEKMMPVGMASGMRKAMKINEETAAVSKNEVQKVYLEMSERLESNGSEYLMDSASKSYGFTAVDLTFAALSAPMIRPPEMTNFCLRDEELPPELLEFSKAMTSTLAGQHVLKVYGKHRLTNADEKVVSIKGVDRNRSLWPF